MRMFQCQRGTIIHEGNIELVDRLAAHLSDLSVDTHVFRHEFDDYKNIDNKNQIETSHKCIRSKRSIEFQGQDRREMLFK